MRTPFPWVAHMPKARVPCAKLNATFLATVSIHAPIRTSLCSANARRTPNSYRLEPPVVGGGILGTHKVPVNEHVLKYGHSLTRMSESWVGLLTAETFSEIYFPLAVRNRGSAAYMVYEAHRK
jgi:hypothetical protein